MPDYGSGGAGYKPPSGGSGGSGGAGGWGSDEDPPPESSLSLREAELLAASAGLALPADYAELARRGALRTTGLQAYLALHREGSVALRWLAARLPAFRDRVLADRLFLFRILAEVSIDSACATVAEVRKRGTDFWSEFELYLSDLGVGLVLDVVLVSLLAPVASAALPGVLPPARQSALARWSSALPSAFFAPGAYSPAQRLGCLALKGLQYGVAGTLCGFVGQGAANALMRAKRGLRQRQGQPPEESEVPIPPLLKTALVWGLFMGVSANLRYQTVFGIESLVDRTVAKSVPALGYATTLAVRFANNVLGGEQFVDLARWAGVQ